jgi:hypothetical protein
MQSLYSLAQFFFYSKASKLTTAGSHGSAKSGTKIKIKIEWSPPILRQKGCCAELPVVLSQEKKTKFAWSADKFMQTPVVYMSATAATLGRPVCNSCNTAGEIAQRISATKSRSKAVKHACAVQ